MYKLKKLPAKKVCAPENPKICMSCTNRKWVQIGGFQIMGCPIKRLRFGTITDIRKNVAKFLREHSEYSGVKMKFANDLEKNRIDAIINNSGLSEALEFAKRTIRIYRTCVLHSRKRGYKKPHHASTQQYRRGFIESYLYLKWFINENKITIRVRCHESTQNTETDTCEALGAQELGFKFSTDRTE